MILLAIFNLVCFAQETVETPIAETPAVEEAGSPAVEEPTEIKLEELAEPVAEEAKVEASASEEAKPEEAPVAEEAKPEAPVAEEAKPEEALVAEEAKPEAPVAEEHKVDLEKIRTYLDHHDAKIRQETIETLVAAGDVAIFDEVINRLQEHAEQDSSVLATMVHALIDSKNPELIAKGLATFTEKDKANEELALALCNAANAISDLDTLSYFANSNYAKVSNYALENLLAKVQKDNANLLFNLLWSENVEVRRNVFQTLLSFQPKDLGYDPEGELIARATGIANWKKWWEATLLINDFMAASDSDLNAVVEKIAKEDEAIAPYFIEIYNDLSSIRKDAILKLLVHWRSTEVINFFKQVYTLDEAHSSAALHALITLQANKKDARVQLILKEIFSTTTNKEEKIRLAGLLAVAPEDIAINWIKENMKDASQAVLIMPVLAMYNVSNMDESIVPYLGKEKIAFETLMKLKSWKTLADNLQKLTPEQQISFLEVTTVKPNTNVLIELFKATKDTKLQLAILRAINVQDLDKNVALFDVIFAGEYAQEIYKDAVQKIHFIKDANKSMPILTKVVTGNYSDDVKKNALSQLRLTDKVKATEILANILDSSKDANWRSVVLAELCMIDKEKAQPYFEKIVNSENIVEAELRVLAENNAELAKKSFVIILLKAKTDAEKVIVLDTLKNFVTAECIDTLLGYMDSDVLAPKSMECLTKLTGMTGDLSTPEARATFIDKCKSWKTLQDGSREIIAKLLKAQTDEERMGCCQALAIGKDIALENMKIAYRDAQSVEDKITLLHAFAFVRNAQVPMIAMRDANEKIRKVAYECLYSIKAVAFLDEIPFYFMAEINLANQVYLLSLMKAEQIDNLVESWDSYLALTDVKDLDLLVSVINKSSNKDKVHMLLQIAKRDAKLAEKVLPLLPEKIQLDSVADLMALLENEAYAEMYPAVIAKIATVAEFANVKTKEEAIASWTANKEKIQKEVAFRSEIINFLNGTSQNVPATLATRLQETTWANEFLTNLYKANFQPVNVLNLLAIVKNDANNALIAEALNNENDAIRHSAASLMYKFVTVDHELVASAFAHKDAVVRFYAVQMFGNAGKMEQLEAALKDEDARIREEAMFWLLENNTSNEAIVDNMINDRAPEVKAMAIKLAAIQKNKKHYDLLIASLLSPYPSIHDEAYNALKVLSGTDYSTTDEKTKTTQPNIAGWQKWYQKQTTNEKIATLVKQLTDKDMEAENVQRTLAEVYTNAPDAEMKKAVLDTMLAELKKDNAEIKVAMLAVFARLGERGLAMELLPSMKDENVAVRKAAMNAIEALTAEKIELEMVEDATAWNEKVDAWSKAWNEKESKIKLEKDLASLAETTKVLDNVLKIWNKEQVTSLEKTVDFLYNPSEAVRTKALETIQRYIKDAQLNNAASEDERASDITNIKDSVKDIAKKVDDDAKLLPERINEIQNAEGNLLTVEGCVKMQDLVDQFMFEENPSILKAYLEFFTAKGCETFGYDVNNSSKVREEKTTQIADFLYNYKSKLKVADKEGETILANPENFNIPAMDSPENIAKAKQVVSYLTHMSYAVRQKAYATLSALDASVVDYKPEQTEKQRAESVQAWNNWIEEKEAEFEKTKAEFVSHVVAINETIAAVETLEDYNNVALLVSAINIVDEELQAKTIATLEKISGQANGKDVAKWNAWLEAEKAELDRYNNVLAELKGVENAPKAKHVADVEKIEKLVAYMNDDSLKVRQVAFEILSAYVAKNAANEVREDFGYEANAPKEVREVSMKEWNKWFTEKVQPIATAEKERILQVTTACDTLTKNAGVKSQADYAYLAQIVAGLTDELLEIRVKSFQFLRKFAKETFGYNPNIDLAKQQNSIEAWNKWLQKEKVNVALTIENQKRALKSLVAQNAKFTNIAQADDAEKIIKSLLSQEKEMREIAFAWLKEQTNETFSYNVDNDPEMSYNDYASIQEWLRIKKAVLMIEDCEPRLAQGINNDSDISVLDKLLELVDDPTEAIAKRATAALSKLSNIEVQDKPLAKAFFASWIKAQKALVAFKAKVNNANDEAQKVKLFVEDGLDSEELEVRSYAFDMIKERAKVQFKYQAKDSEEVREENRKEIDEWYKKNY
jgi:hypothetical protein